jgi:serine/threonine-protein kinase
MSTPEKIGRYEIIEELGRGGMAVVYLALDPLMDRQVAIKLLPRQLTFDESLRGRFQREAKIVASLEHPAIVPVHDFGEYNEQPYLVMRYMVGGSLRQHTHSEPQTLSEVVRILSPLSQALDMAHTQHIIHRDLKPDNILFDADENPYLSDFGIARLAEGTQTTSIMGTPAYMSPEQIKGDVKLDGRSDIYALGVILFELLSGEQPYTADTPTQVMMKHVLEPIPLILDRVSDLPPMTQMVIDRAMAKERDDRYATAEDLLQAVKELLTASQAAEVGAAVAGTMIQETMLEFPDPEPDPLQTVVERTIPTPGSEEIEREAQPPAKSAVQSEPALDEPELVKKDSPSRGRQILLFGCAITVLIVLCLVLVGVIGNYMAADETSEPAIGSGVSAISVTDALPVVDETDLVTSTPLEEVAATRTLEPAPTQPDPNPEPLESAAGEILFSDTFDGKSAAENWDLWQDEDAEFGIDNGTLVATGFDEDTLNWVKQIDFYTNLELSVTADILAGGSSAFFGVVFDGQGENYVGCFIQGDNSAYCEESLDGETEYGDWVIVDLSVLRDNEILFIVSDEEWAMAVNGKCVGSGFVDFGPEGQPALAVSTDTNEEVASIAYDDFLLRTPTEHGLALLQCEPEYYE